MKLYEILLNDCAKMYRANQFKDQSLPRRDTKKVDEKERAEFRSTLRNTITLFIHREIIGGGMEI